MDNLIHFKLVLVELKVLVRLQQIMLLLEEIHGLSAQPPCVVEVEIEEFIIRLPVVLVEVILEMVEEVVVEVGATPVHSVPVVEEALEGIVEMVGLVVVRLAMGLPVQVVVEAAVEVAGLPIMEVVAVE